MDNNKIILQEGSKALSLFSCIEHVVEEVSINQRALDGYINATEICRASNKKINDCLRQSTTDAFILELSSETGIPVSDLIYKIKGFGVDQSNWVHPQVAINLGQWEKKASTGKVVPK